MTPVLAEPCMPTYNDLMKVRHPLTEPHGVPKRPPSNARMLMKYFIRRTKR